MQIALLPLQAYFTRAAGARRVRMRIEPAATDRELVQRSRQGDRWAEEALYQRHVGEVMRVTLRLLARSSEAEDVVQDAFVSAFRRLDQLSDDEAFGAWVLQIAVREAHRRFRRRKLLRRLGLDRGEDDVSLASQADPAASPELLAILGEVDQALERLPAAARMAWILRYVEGYRSDEVARACGCSRATAKRLLLRARASLDAYVEEESANA